MTCRILHVDDHELTRAGCALLLSRLDRYEIVGTLDKGTGVLDFILTEEIDIVILDLVLPDMNGMSLLAELIGIHDMTVMILTGQDDPKDFSFALKMGVRAIVRKSDPAEEIVDALDKVRKGESFLSTTVREQLDSFSTPNIQLSPRQSAILHYLAIGETNKEIGCKLGIAMPTVSFHLAEIRKKLGVSNNKKITQAAIDSGIV